LTNGNQYNDRAKNKPLFSLLSNGEIQSVSILPDGSNYSFLVSIEDSSGNYCKAIYKPKAGEKALWDFHTGTLFRREYLTYLVSQALGWPSVPLTVIRDGPYGEGSIQLFVDAVPGSNYFTLWEDNTDEFRRIALFDCLVNNADRKAGHCILGRDGYIWNIDHGLTFHHSAKLRTVIWEFCGQPIPEALLLDLESFIKCLSSNEILIDQLKKYLSTVEVQALENRANILLKKPVFPQLSPYINVPWPWI